MAAKMDADDKEMFIYFTQIKHLDEQLQRCRLKFDSLKKQRKDLVSLRRGVEKDRTDLGEYLQHCVASQRTQVERLLAEMTWQRQTAAQVREALQLQHRLQEQQLQQQVDRLTADSNKQEMVVEQQEEQLMELMQWGPVVLSLEEQLVKQQEKYKVAIHSLQHDAMVERSRLMKEMQKTQDDVVKPQVPKTRDEGARHRELPEIQELLDKNNVLFEEGEVLKETEEHLSSQVDELRTNLEKLEQEVSSSGEEVERLRKQLQRKEEEVNNRRLHIERLQESEENERLLLVSAADECSRKSAKVDRLRAALQAESSRRRQLEGDVQEATVILELILKQDSRKLSRKQRDRLLKLLKPPPAPQETAADVPEETGTGQDEQASVSKPIRDPLLLMVCYRPGDFGLVPRPRWKHRAAPSGARLPLGR